MSTYGVKKQVKDTEIESGCQRCLAVTYIIHHLRPTHGALSMHCQWNQIYQDQKVSFPHLFKFNPKDSIP